MKLWFERAAGLRIHAEPLPQVGDDLRFEVEAGPAGVLGPSWAFLLAEVLGPNRFHCG